MKRITRDRRLTPEEAAKYKAIREMVAAELPDLVVRHHEREQLQEVLAQLKALGVRLSIDDFGTGYSSLSRLRRIPVDTLKIDRAFISNMDTDPENREIVRAIIVLAHNLGLKVVAEGTETEEHINLLKELNCEMAQGYLFSRPADERAMSKLLASNRSAVGAVAAGG